MKIEHIFLVSNYDGLKISVLYTIPNNKPKGIIQIVHGMAEHKERYNDVAKYFTLQGFVVIIHDHRGHGESVKCKNDLGYFYTNNEQAFIEDTHQVADFIKTKFRGLPLIMLGHSMGSLIARCYAKKYDVELDGLIVCGSPSRNSLAGLAKVLIRFFEIIKGERYRSKMIDWLALGLFHQKFKDEASRNAWICSDKAVVDAFDLDERCGFMFTLNGFDNLMSLMKETYKQKDWRVNNKNLPILYIAGKEDPCIVNEKSYLYAINFMKRIGYTNVEFVLYDEMRHEILNEKKKEIVYKDIMNWCSKLKI